MKAKLKSTTMIIPIRSTHIILSKRNLKKSTTAIPVVITLQQPPVPGGSNDFLIFMELQNNREHPKKKPNKQTNNQTDKQKQNRQTDAQPT
jgi:hypothetical protein